MSGWRCSPGRVSTTTRTAFGSASLGYDLVEKRGLTRYQARTYMYMGAMVSLGQSMPPVDANLCGGRSTLAYRIGDLTFASYSWDQLITICLGGLAIRSPKYK